MKAYFIILLILATYMYYASAPNPKSGSTPGVPQNQAAKTSSKGSSPCCRNTGETNKECCDEKTEVCCGDEYGCVTPCPSQFDAIPCNEVAITNSLTKQDCPDRLVTRKLYRVTDPNQNCKDGLIAKDPDQKKTVSSHVGCGGRKNYKSQYISFSTSYGIVYNKYWPKKPPGANLVEVDIDSLPSGCKTYDLTVEKTREKLVGHNPRAKNYAKSDCEVLLECGTSPVPCKTLKGPKSDKKGKGESKNRKQEL